MLEASLRILFSSKDLSAVKAYCVRQWGKILANRVSVQARLLAAAEALPVCALCTKRPTTLVTASLQQAAAQCCAQPHALLCCATGCPKCLKLCTAKQTYCTCRCDRRTLYSAKKYVLAAMRPLQQHCHRPPLWLPRQWLLTHALSHAMLSECRMWCVWCCGSGATPHPLPCPVLPCLVLFPAAAAAGNCA